MILSFSGGGTRAAALAYGVMLELRDTKISIEGKSGRLLDQVTTISSVSGGSFTSAYYGLYGDGLFETFEESFLRKDVEGALIRSVLNPFHWFGRKGRTERTIEYYQENIFHGATF
jgi:NTE family protein